MVGFVRDTISSMWGPAHLLGGFVADSVAQSSACLLRGPPFRWLNAVLVAMSGSKIVLALNIEKK